MKAIKSAGLSLILFCQGASADDIVFTLTGELVYGQGSISFVEQGYQFTLANTAIFPAQTNGHLESSSITVSSLDHSVFDVTSLGIGPSIATDSNWVNVTASLAGQDGVFADGSNTQYFYNAGPYYYTYTTVPGVPSMSNLYANETTALLTGFDSYTFSDSLGVTLTGLSISNANVAAVPLPAPLPLFAGALGVMVFRQIKRKALTAG